MSSLDLRRLALLASALLLTACGFHLRGQGTVALPFQILYVKSPADYAPFIVELKRAIEASKVRVTDDPEQAQLTLHIVSEATDKQILSLSGAGRVREYRLQYRVSLRLYDHGQQDWLAPEEITLRRDFSYDDVQVLAKEQEEAMLYQNMRGDAVQQILRRLNHAKPPQRSMP
jgi:LPS-assembly lipoprotein